MILRNLVRLPLAAAFLAGIASTAGAQHTNIVLFGEPDPAFKDEDKDQIFVLPCTSPYYHEDSFVTTDLRFWYAYQRFDSEAALGKGHGEVVAAQARVALTDRLQLVAYKDGYMWLSSEGLDESGWNDIGAGLKWNFYRDVPNNFHMAVGAGYQFPWGDEKVLQNDSEARVWFSIDKGFGKFHIGGTLNGLFATTTDEKWGNSQRIGWDVHMDYRLCDWFSPVIEFDGVHSLHDSHATLPFQGADLGNFGQGESDPVVMFGVGGEVRPFDHIALRAMWETQVDHQADLFDWRATVSVVISF